MSMDTITITKDECCQRCRAVMGQAERGVFPLLNMQDEAEEVQKIADDYNARGVTGPWCRRCGRLPVVNE
jgi:hypothetical protein